MERGYDEAVASWLEAFPREQMLIIKSEDLFLDTSVWLDRIQSFLGVPKHQYSPERIQQTWRGTSDTCSKEIGYRPPLAREDYDEINSSLAESAEKLRSLLGDNFQWHYDDTTRVVNYSIPLNKAVS